MRLLGVGLLVASLGLSGCADTLRSQQTPAKWTTGFWFWHGVSADTSAASGILDVLYVHAGTIQKMTGPFAKEPWLVYGQLPDRLPAAREYWLVFRFEHQAVPDPEAAPAVVRQFSKFRETARQRHLNVIGVQLDIDSPTGALQRYAGFLRAVRKDLTPGVQVSITALLDWFRNGTAISDVVMEADEFVPQFYDVANPDSGGDAIAEKLDADLWGPIFNRFGKRFRIGISTFGRARLVPGANSSQSRYSRVTYFRDVTPVDIAIQPAFSLQTARNDANELVLNYRATLKTRVSYNSFEAGDTVQFILATPETIRAAVENAKRMRGNAAGVIFFRWPAPYETLAMQPDEVLSAAGLIPHREHKPAVYLVDGGCVAVECVDVYLLNPNPLSAQPVRYRIHSSEALEYFLPEEKMPVRMLGAHELELALAPYCGRARIFLGRAVAAKPIEFTVQQQQ